MKKRKEWPLSRPSCIAETAYFVAQMTPDLPDRKKIVKWLVRAIYRQWERAGKQPGQYTVAVTVSSCKVHYQYTEIDLECDLPRWHHSACWSESVTIAHVAAITLTEEVLVKRVAQEVADALPDGIRVVFKVIDELLKYTKQMSVSFEASREKEGPVWPEHFYSEYKIVLDWIAARPVYYTFGAEKHSIASIIKKGGTKH